MSGGAGKRVVVTGGCGFVGCNLVAALKRQGHTDLTLLDDESVGRRAHVDEGGVRFLIGDIRDAALVDQAVSEADVVVHLAADTRVIDSLQDPRKGFDINVDGTLKLLEAMRRHGKRRIINASTGGAILGNVTPPVHEEMVPRPISPYGASKLAVEGYLSAFEGGFGMAPISFRFSNVYGPRSFHKGSVVAAYFKRILKREKLPVYGDGKQTRDFVFVDDITRVVAEAVDHEETGVFQLGSGRATSIEELVGLMCEIVGDDLRSQLEYLPARRGEIRDTYCDISLARERLRFSPRTELPDGLRATWQWFEDHWKRT